MPHAVYRAFQQHVVVIVHILITASQAGKVLFGLAIVTLRERDVGHANGDLLIGSACFLGALIQFLRQIEFVHRQENISRSDEIVGGGWSGLAYTRFSKSKRHLLASVVKLMLIYKQPCERQAGFYTVRVRSVECLRKALLRSFFFAEQQQCVASCKQHSALVWTLLLRKLHVSQRLRAHLQFGFSMGTLGEQERIIRHFADRKRQLIHGGPVLMFIVERVSKRDVQRTVARSKSNRRTVFRFRFLELTKLPVRSCLHLMNGCRCSQKLFSFSRLVERIMRTMQFEIRKCGAQPRAAIVRL